MTTREWQHGLYVRDRWQVNDKLTLDLGLRYEYYPLMSRADRGIEQVDLNARWNVSACGGVGGQPEGSRHQGEQDAVRAAAWRRLSHERQHGVPGRLRHHVQPAAVLAAAARLLPADDRRAAAHATDPFGSATTLEQGIPDIAGSRPELGQRPAAELVR